MIGNFMNQINIRRTNDKLVSCQQYEQYKSNIENLINSAPLAAIRAEQVNIDYYKMLIKDERIMVAGYEDLQPEGWSSDVRKKFIVQSTSDYRNKSSVLTHNDFLFFLENNAMDNAGGMSVALVKIKDKVVKLSTPSDAHEISIVGINSTNFAFTVTRIAIGTDGVEKYHSSVTDVYWMTFIQSSSKVVNMVITAIARYEGSYTYVIGTETHGAIKLIKLHRRDNGENHVSNIVLLNYPRGINLYKLKSYQITMDKPCLKDAVDPELLYENNKIMGRLEAAQEQNSYDVDDELIKMFPLKGRYIMELAEETKEELDEEEYEKMTEEYKKYYLELYITVSFDVDFDVEMED